MTTATPAPAVSRWRASPARLLRLFAGLWLFGTGDALMINAMLGNGPWTVLAEGVALHTPMTIGIATQVIGLLVLAGWFPLRVKPGLGTLSNVIVIGIAIDVMRQVIPEPEAFAVRLVALVCGTILVGIGSGFYLTAELGPGPRDGWMTGLHRRFGWPLAWIRMGIEVTVLALGALLGGTVGVGTVLFALLIGPAVGTAMRVLAPGRRRVPAGAPRA